ncbi:bifunctional metallophosphatase/5'-nucleotidase [Haploplasma modicum]|uniref:bifunctional metallophosphatase/5'-nucleotidase n=1 Tax=Haploplasma modicum TaxID=2150 RepID=UPI00047A5780|nr:bifunctional UDP-sugar hydrolase/5'-nucleotidase [Haploplasma modicum]
MKRILMFFTVLMLSLFLVSCDKEVYNVEFYEGSTLLETLEYKKNEVITLSKLSFIEKEGYEFSYFLDKENGEKFELTTKINKPYKLDVNFKSINLERDNNFDIFYLNDTHGAILNKGSELGLAKIANYINKEKDENSLFVVGGDMFQGQLISNANKGQLMVEVFNELKLDAFVLGNHEFDWGLDTILKYFDQSNHDVKANFPLLGANVINKKTNLRPDGIKDYHIVDRKGVKVGIIGVIGDGLESSISTPRVSDYKFTNAYNAFYETYLKIEQSVDFVIAANHSADQSFNEKVGNLNKVSAIFNGHSHTEYKGLINNKVPYLQSGSNGQMVGRVNLEFDSNFNLTKGVANNIKSSVNLDSPDLRVEAIIDRYYNEMSNLYNEVLIEAENLMNQKDLANYISRLMTEVTNSVAGFQNSGGTRATLYQGQQITSADIFQIFPFDNQIIFAEVKGYELKKLLDNSYFISYKKIEYRDIVDNNIYQIATNDYIFYSEFNKDIFGDKEGIMYGDMYETFRQVLINMKEEGYKFFDKNSPIIGGLK